MVPRNSGIYYRSDWYHKQAYIPQVIGFSSRSSLKTIESIQTVILHKTLQRNDKVPRKSTDGLSINDLDRHLYDVRSFLFVHDGPSLYSDTAVLLPGTPFAYPWQPF